MSHNFVPATLAILLAAAGPSTPASAQAAACDAAHLGTVACFVSKLCACSHFRGGGMTGVPAGYRWDCGALRPGCGADVAAPATIDPYLGQLPSALSLDRNQTIVNTQTGGRNNSQILGDRSPGTVVIQPSLPAER